MYISKKKYTKTLKRKTIVGNFLIGEIYIWSVHQTKQVT